MDDDIERERSKSAPLKPTLRRLRTSPSRLRVKGCGTRQGPTRKNDPSQAPFEAHLKGEAPKIAERFFDFVTARPTLLTRESS
jgi:hypothetical protein